MTSCFQEVTSATHQLQIKPGASTTIDISVKNTGAQTWFTNSATAGVDASYGWLDSAGVELPTEGERTWVDPHEIQAGESRLPKLKVVGPPKPGSYTLLISMVQEGVVWFYAKGANPLVLQVTTA